MVGATTARGGTRLPQITAFLLGAAFTVNGMAGFAITGVEDFTAHTGHDLLGFNINPLHNLVHLTIGVVGLLTCWRPASARLFGWLLVIGYGSVLTYGIFVIGDPKLNILALNAADNVLHGFAAFAGLLIAMWGSDRPPAGRRPAVAALTAAPHRHEPQHAARRSHR